MHVLRGHWRDPSPRVTAWLHRPPLPDSESGYAAEVHHRGLSRWRSGKCASRERPFLYFPLRNHFEQNRHVRQRLARYGAGRFMDYDASPPDVIAGAIAEEIDRPVDYRPVESDGAARAAALIAPLI